MINTENRYNNVIYFILFAAEIFLIISIIYSLVSIFKDQTNKISIDAKNIEIEKSKLAIKAIFENNKSIITTYKDCEDELNAIQEKYCETNKRIDGLLCDFEVEDVREEIKIKTQKFVISEREKEYNDLKVSLINQYNRFLGNITNILKNNLEKYLASKGCNESIAIAIKQLAEPVLYKDINNENINVFTAFRDYRTYSSRKRNGTWEKSFSITKNSDFIMSIEKDYYIFNYMNKKYLDDGLYQNENTSFYENYNSGVTCTIYSCINGERKLYGYLACDSLLKEKNRRKVGDDVFDWNMANMMMFVAHIIAMYLEKFLRAWDEYYIKYNKFKGIDSSEIELGIEYNDNFKNDDIKPELEEGNFCMVMKKQFKKQGLMDDL